MIRYRYANLQDVDRLPKKGDIVITENGNRVIVSGYNKASWNVLVGLTVHKPHQLYLLESVH